jgi:hypothetical protein
LPDDGQRDVPEADPYRLGYGYAPVDPRSKEGCELDLPELNLHQKQGISRTSNKEQLHQRII